MFKYLPKILTPPPKKKDIALFSTDYMFVSYKPDAKLNQTLCGKVIDVILKQLSGSLYYQEEFP